MDNISEQVTDGYTVMWALNYFEGKFWYSTGYGTGRKGGTRAIHIYHQNGQLYFDVEECINYIAPFVETKEQLIHELKGYFVKVSPPAYPAVEILPNMPLSKRLES